MFPDQQKRLSEIKTVDKETGSENQQGIIREKFP